MTRTSVSDDPDQSRGGRRLDRRKLRYLRVLGRYLAPYRLRLAGALAALVIAAVGVLAFGAGLRWLVDEGFKTGSEGALHTALDLRVQLSSCVPATHLETSGARLGAAWLSVLSSRVARSRGGRLRPNSSSCNWTCACDEAVMTGTVGIAIAAASMSFI